MSRNTVTLQTQTQTETLDLEMHKAVHAFAQALTESNEFRAFEQAAEAFAQDEIAQTAIQAFQEKQQALQMMLMLNAVSPEDKQEMERLQKTFMAQPSVIEYMRAQEELSILCQQTANLLSERIGLSYAAACGPGCC